MKTFITLLLALIITSFTFAQPKTDWNANSLKGKVKSVQTKETYRYKKDGKTFTPWERTYTKLSKFNPSGFTTEYLETDKNDSVNYKMLHTYAPKEKKSNVQYFNRKGLPTTKTTYLYDSKQFRTEELQYSPEGELSRRYIYTFDDKGNMLTMTAYKNDGTLLGKTTWKYDQNGYRSEYKYESPGYATSIKLYVNDSKGNNLEEIWGNGRGVIDFRMVRTYDAQGNKIKEITYKGSSETPHNTTTWRLEYDKNGNWIKRTQSDRNGEDFQIEERSLVYY